MNTRTRLLDSAESVCRQRGYTGFSFADLAKDVGIRKASIHHHFHTKADLTLSLIDRYATGVFDELRRIESSAARPSEQLAAYHEVYRRALNQGDQVCLCVALSLSRDSLTDQIIDRLNQFHKDSIDWLARVFAKRNSTAPIADARATLALMEGAQLIARAARDITLFDQATESFLANLTSADTD